MLDFLLCDLDGHWIGDLGARQGARIEVELNGRKSYSLALSFDDPTGRWIEALNKVVKCFLMGQPICCGPILRPAASGQQRAWLINGSDPSHKLMHSFVGQNQAALAGHVAGNNFRWEQVDQSEIMMRLMEHADDPATLVPHLGVVRGNSAAASFLRDREYEQGKQIWEAMQQLSEVIDSVDFDLRAVDREDGVYAALDTYYPYMGRDLRESIVFEYNWGLMNAVDFSWEPAGDQVRNRSTHAGQKNEETGAQPIVTVDHEWSKTAYGVYGEFVGEPDVVTTQTLTEHAGATVNNWGLPVNFFSFTPASDDGQGFRRRPSGGWEHLPDTYGVPYRFAPNGDFWLGDLITVVAKDPPGLGAALEGRVVAGVINELPNGAIVNEITCVPLITQESSVAQLKKTSEGRIPTDGPIVRPRPLPGTGDEQVETGTTTEYGGSVIRGVKPPTVVSELERIRQGLRNFQIIQP